MRTVLDPISGLIFPGEREALPAAAADLRRRMRLDLKLSPKGDQGVQDERIHGQGRRSAACVRAEVGV